MCVCVCVAVPRCARSTTPPCSSCCRSLASSTWCKNGGEVHVGQSTRCLAPVHAQTDDLARYHRHALATHVVCQEDDKIFRPVGGMLTPRSPRLLPSNFTIQRTCFGFDHMSSTKQTHAHASSAQESHILSTCVYIHAMMPWPMTDRDLVVRADAFDLLTEVLLCVKMLCVSACVPFCNARLSASLYL